MKVAHWNGKNFSIIDEVENQNVLDNLQIGDVVNLTMENGTMMSETQVIVYNGWTFEGKKNRKTGSGRDKWEYEAYVFKKGNRRIYPSAKRILSIYK